MAVHGLTVIVMCLMIIGNLADETCGQEPRPRDCQDIYHYISQCSGDYTVYVGRYLKPVKVFCEMDNYNGKGCIVFQRRMDGSENFYRKWADYARGFGNLHAEHWLGNDNIFLITNQDNYTLHINMKRFNGVSGEVKYSVFKVDSAYDKYRLTVGGFSSSNDCWGDSFSYSSGSKFTTYDQDHDTKATYNCAVRYRTAWWMNGCFRCSLNGPANPSGHIAFAMGIMWRDNIGYYEPLQFTEMKLCR